MSSTVDYRKPLTGFLALAPATSGTNSPAVPTLEVAKPAVDGSASIARRSSSVSTTNSNAPALRFLKLGPVHFGEHQDADDKEDWSAVAE